MKRSIAAWAMTTSLVLGGAAFAQTLDKVVKVGSLGDQSGLYQDIGGPGSSVAAQMAIEDSGLLAKGWKIDLITRTSRMSASISASNGSTSRRSTCSSISQAPALALRSPTLRRSETSSI
jgi:branched-chain amino acid transport system substrate-binding protein